MALEVGRKLGVYEITAAIGVGGMGEVYRAKDTKLGRDVAIKVLPEDFARDPERLARFEREARVLASLNHPNIAAIHGLEEHDAQPFLVLELVEGEDLAERLKRGPIPVDEVVEIAKQIAEALEEAHEKGIIHRDLKPPNVKTTPDGVVKVLDFGLAKAFSGETSQDVNLSDSPTRLRQGFGEASPATMPGVILGTAAYMSPEQAKGKAVDRRADIWSFGAPVYEMLTGAKAFARDDVSETLAAILRDEPDWNRLPSQTPSHVRRLLERCLRKNSRERQRDMGDSRLELSGMNEEPASVAVATHSRRALAGTAAAAFAAGAILVGVFSHPTQPPLRVTRMVVPLPAGLKLVERLTSPIAISPDGRTLAYAAEGGDAGNLYRRPLESNDAKAVPGTQGGHTPFFSPDGKWLGFFTDEALMKVPVDGGPPMKLAPAQARNRGASRGDDGSIVFAPDSGADAVLMRVSQGGGDARAITSVSFGHPQTPELLPDGTILDGRTGTDYEHLMKFPPGSDEPSPLGAPEGSFSYLPTGHLLHVSDGSIGATPFAIDSDETEGEGRIVLEGVATGSGGRHIPYLAVSKNGTLADVSGLRQEGGHAVARAKKRH